MKYLKLQTRLNELWSGIIEKLNIDVLNNTVYFKINTIDEGTSKNFDLLFKGVSSVYFIKDIGEKRHELTEYDIEDYIEFTSIDYYKDGVGDIKINSHSQDWVSQWRSTANFAIELWNSILFLEAKEVVINDEIFEVNYPSA